MATVDEPVDLDDLLAFARAYRELGDAVTEQVQDLIDGEQNYEGLNPNAVRLIEQRVARFHPGIAEACADYFEWLEAERAAREDV